MLALIVGIGVFAGLAIWCAVKSEGFLEGDACAHYLMARFALVHPESLLDVWGRPLCTGLHALPAAWGGRLAVQMTSLAMAVVSGIAVYRIATKEGYRLPALAAILLFAQPIYFCHSWSELTEVPFAMVTILAFWAFASRKFFVMALLVGLTPLGRPEGFGLMILAAAALVVYRRWYWIGVLPMWLISWTLLGWLEQTAREGATGHAWYGWLWYNWPYATRSAYGRGPIYHFGGMLPILVSPMMFPMLLVGIWRGVFSREDDKGTRGQGNKGIGGGGGDSHRRVVELGIVGIPVLVLVVHSVLWWQGLMASNGELRYLLTVSPLWALVTARGFEWVWDRLRLPAPLWVAAALACAPVIANFAWPVIPLKLSDRERLAKVSVEWCRGQADLVKEYPRVMASYPGVYYWLDISPKDREKCVPFERRAIEQRSAGVILFWDEEYGSRNADERLIARESHLKEAGWIPLRTFYSGSKSCTIYLSPRSAATIETRRY